MARLEEVTIRCAGGVSPSLRSLYQDPTYAGLLDGAPTHEINEQLLERTTGTPEGATPTYLVRPKETPLKRRHVGPHGPAMTIPMIHCRGLFRLGALELWIEWYQDTWAPPISATVKAELRNLDFHAIAKDNDFW